MAARAERPPPTALERLLARDRLLIAASLSFVAILAWTYLILMARQMANGDMSLLGMGEMSGASTEQPAVPDEMPGMPGMPQTPGAAETPAMPGMRDEEGAGGAMAEAVQAAPVPWSPRTFMLTFFMWWVMMIGMMIPSAVPMIAMFGAVQRRQLAEENPALRVAFFTSGYLGVWGVFSLIAASAQWGLANLAVLAPMQMTVNRGLAALFLVLAGIFQLSPLKNICLRLCRSPAEFLSLHWHKGTAGAFRIGAEHGVFCVGCCWLLMVLLFVGGVMNLLWVAAIAVLVLLEKLVPRGELLARASGVAMIAAGGYLIL